MIYSVQNINDSFSSLSSICKLLESTFEYISMERCDSKLLSDSLTPIFNSLIEIVMNNKLIIKYNIFIYCKIVLMKTQI